MAERQRRKLEVMGELWKRQERPDSSDFSNNESYDDLSPEAANTALFGERLASRIPAFNGSNAEEVFAALRNLEENPSVAALRAEIEQERLRLKKLKYDYEHGRQSSPSHAEEPHQERKASDYYKELVMLESQEKATEELEAQIAETEAAYEKWGASVEKLRGMIDSRGESHAPHSEEEHAQNTHDKERVEAHPHPHAHAEHPQHAGLSRTERLQAIDKLLREKSSLIVKFYDISNADRYVRKHGSLAELDKWHKDNLSKRAHYERIEQIDALILELRHDGHNDANHGHDEHSEHEEHEAHSVHGHAGTNNIEEGWVTSRDGRRLAQIDNAQGLIDEEILETLRKQALAHERRKVVDAMHEAGVEIPEDIEADMAGESDEEDIDRVRERLSAGSEERRTEEFLDPEDEQIDYASGTEKELRSTMSELINQRFALAGMRGGRRLGEILKKFAESRSNSMNPTTADLFFEQFVFAAQNPNGRYYDGRLPPVGVRTVANLISNLALRDRRIRQGTPEQVLRQTLRYLPEYVELASRDPAVSESSKGFINYLRKDLKKMAKKLARFA